MYNILNKFNFQCDIKSITENSIGLINKTYLIKTNNQKYILQKINNKVFNNIELLMQNIELITDYLKSYGHKTLNIISTKEDKLYDIDKGEYWRVFEYIEGKTFQNVINHRIVSESARQLAIFHRDLKSFTYSSLHIVIPDFHNTQSIFKRFKQVVFDSSTSLSKECHEEFNYILGKEKELNLVSSLIEEKKIPLRICHNDPKLTNFIFDKQFNAISLIDLDTVMPGTWLMDISDAVRTICVSENEDTLYKDKIYFRYDYFEIFLASYLKVNKRNMNHYELNNIVNSLELIFLEQAMRFLIDYATGSSYFKISYKNQNLVRARNQLYLLKEISANKEKLYRLILRYIK